MSMRKRSYRAYVVKTNPNWAFVPHPEIRGAYVRTGVCVVQTACPQCKSPVGVPCQETFPYGYTVDTHHARRVAACRLPHPLRERAKTVTAVEVNLADFVSRIANCQ
jgi:hypothetical protein